MCTNNYWNGTTIVEIILGGSMVSFFETHSVEVRSNVSKLSQHRWDTQLSVRLKLRPYGTMNTFIHQSW